MIDIDFDEYLGRRVKLKADNGRVFIGKVYGYNPGNDDERGVDKVDILNDKDKRIYGIYQDEVVTFEVIEDSKKKHKKENKKVMKQWQKLLNGYNDDNLPIQGKFKPNDTEKSDLGRRSYFDVPLEEMEKLVKEGVTTRFTPCNKHNSWCKHHIVKIDDVVGYAVINDKCFETNYFKVHYSGETMRIVPYKMEYNEDNVEKNKRVKLKVDTKRVFIGKIFGYSLWYDNDKAVDQIEIIDEEEENMYSIDLDEIDKFEIMGG